MTRHTENLDCFHVEEQRGYWSLRALKGLSFMSSFLGDQQLKKGASGLEGPTQSCRLGGRPKEGPGQVKSQVLGAFPALEAGLIPAPKG